MESLLNDTQESEDKLDTSRSSASEDAVVSPRSKDSNSSPRVPFALHIDVDNKENEKGEKSTTPNSRSSTTTTQNKNTNNTKKPRTPTETPSLRAPYAQPVLDASKLHNNESKKSSTEERLASARGRRLQQQKQFESELKSRREREDQAYAKWMQTQEEKRRKIEENKMKDGAHRKEVEQRKKMQLVEDKKKAEAKIAKTEQQVSEVKMRQKRSASSDRTKRWSWGAGAGGSGGGGGVSGYGESPSPFQYFDATRMTKRTPSADKQQQRPKSMHASHFDVSRLGMRFDEPSDQMRSGSLSNLASPSSSKTSDERFSKSPLLINTTHIAFASGLRSYETNPGAGRGVSPDSPRLRRSNSLGARPKKINNGPPVRTASVENIAPTGGQSMAKLPNTRGRSPVPKVTLTTTTRIREQLVKNQKGRTHTSPALTEPITISPRLLAPTRASLARSRNAINDLDDSTSQSSTGSGSHGPMRSRSKDRKVVKEPQPGRSESGGSSPRVDGTKATPPMRKPTPERKSTPTRGSSPMVPNRRAPSPAKKLATATGGLESKTTAVKSASENDKVKKRGVSPHARPYRAPSPAKAKSTADLSTPPRTAPRRGASPSPATTRTKTKVQNDPKPVSTPPSIKPSLRPTTSTQLKTKTSSPTLKTSVKKTTKPAAAKVKQESPKQVEKSQDIKETHENAIKNSNSDSGFQDNPTPSTADLKSTSLETSQIAEMIPGTSEIPKSSSNTSQAVSEIPTSEAEDFNAKESPPGQVEVEKDVSPPYEQQSSEEATNAGGDAPTVNKNPSLDQDASSATQNHDTTEAGGDISILTKDPSQNQDVLSIPQDEHSIDKDSQPESSHEKGDLPQVVNETTETTLNTEAVSELPQDGDALQKPLDPQLLVSQDVALLQDEDEAKDSLEADSGAEQLNSLLDSFQTVEPVDPRAVSPTDSLEEYEPDNDVPIENSLQNELSSAEYPPPDSFDSEDSDSEEQISVKERIQNQEFIVDSPTPEPQIIEDSISSDQPIDELAGKKNSDGPEKQQNTAGQLPKDVDLLIDEVAAEEDSAGPEEQQNTAGQLPKDVDLPIDEPAAQKDSDELEKQNTAGQLPEDVETNDEHPEESQPTDFTSEDSEVIDQQFEEDPSSVTNPQQKEGFAAVPEISNQEDSISEIAQVEAVDVGKIESVMEQDIPQKEDEEAMEKNSGSSASKDFHEDANQRKTNDAEVLAPVRTDEKIATESERSEKSADENAPEQLTDRGDEKTQKSDEVPVEPEVAPVSEKKSQPRKNLATDEEKEAYQRAIAEKRRELKEKKEQEERERQERIRLAKIEQAKREEEARRMFEEAEATAERERKMREEEEKRIKEEEQRKEEEANTRKREAAEKVKREREAAKQKQEDERLARKKRLEMIMRRTRQPDASDSDKPKTDGSLTPSPQHTPIIQSPASGRSPQTQSPVGGISPLTATTPERSVSPAVAAILNKSNDTGSPTSIMTSQANSVGTKAHDVDTNRQNLLNFSNSTKNFNTGVELIQIEEGDKVSDPNIEKPVPFEAFTVKPLANGMSAESNNYSNNKDPFNLFSSESEEIGQQSSVNQDLLSINNDLIQQKTEPMVPTGI